MASKNSDLWWNPDAIGRTWLEPKLRGGSDAQSTTANDMLAAMTRSQWYTFMNQVGAPQEDKLFDIASDPNFVNDAMQRASTTTAGAFDRQAQASDRQLRSLGLTLSADEKAAADRNTSLARATADVNAQEFARRGSRSLQQSILGSPVPTAGS